MNEARNKLAEDRETSRTLGCVGFSAAIHASLLAAMLIIPLTTMLNMGGESAGSRPLKDGGVSMISKSSTVTFADAAPKATEPAIMTDKNSDIVIAEKAVEKMPTKMPEKKSKAEVTPVVTVVVAKPVSEKPKPTPKEAKARPVAKTAILKETQAEEVQTEEEAAPTLLANPPSDDETVPEQTEEKEIAAAVVTKEPVPVAVATTGGGVRSESNENAPLNNGGLPAAGGQGSRENANTAGSGAAASAIAGPVRDASELRALPGNPNPVYPARDRLAHKEGTSVIIGTVSPDGRVTGAQVERSSGSSDMDAASLQAFRSWRFQAGQQGRVRKPFQFRLVGDAKEIPAPLGGGLKRSSN